MYYDVDDDLDIEDVREDFDYIWSKNIVEVELIREKNPQAGDYFREGESPETLRKKIWVNIQGTSSDLYKRMVMGIITPDATLHIYVRWDEDIEDLDIIKFGNWTYRIEGFNKSRYAGQTAFQDFDIKRIDKA